MNCKTSFWIIYCLAFIVSLNAYAQVLEFIPPVEIANGMEFTEGPAWHPDGYLVFSDVNANVIYKWSESSGLDTLVYPAGNSNGIACAKTNDFVVCRHGSRDVALMDDKGNLSTLMSAFKGKRLNSPNDVTLSFTGSIYFTDPDYGVAQEDRELSFEGLYCIPYYSNEPVLLDSTLVKPNGLTFASDWRTLYINETSSNKIYSYFLRDDIIIKDMTSDKKVFLELDNSGEIDGITADVYGNLFVAFGQGGIKIFDKDAHAIGTIDFQSGSRVRNLCFGGKYKNILFVTAGTSLYKVEIRYNGDLIAPGLLGIPTDKSVVFNAVSDKTLTAYIAYGKSATHLDQQTSQLVFQAEIPIEIEIDRLEANTAYFYELRFKKEGEANFTASTNGHFFTQRAKGESFSFAVEADPHLDEASNYTTFRNMLQNASEYQNDFLIDLGDNFLTEKFPVFNEYYAEQRNLLYRHFWDNVCKSMPLFLVIGNHEGELRWREDMLDIATATRKKYYPTPFPNDFYTGSDSVESIGLRENYYAWNWGDALFVVIDMYGYTEVRSKDPWCFTLGKKQYNWFKQTLGQSNAKYKFVFAHQLVGGDSEGRGGTEIADYFEMGGENSDDSYGFNIQRPDWEKPLHQIMVENGVQIYFHGHDHFYAEQEKDGMIYQLVPQPSFPGYTNANDAENYGYFNGIILPNSGHLQVTVMDDSAKVEYIGAYHVDNAGKGLINGQVRRTYYVSSNISEVSSIQNPVINNKLQAHATKNAIILQSPVSFNGNISLFSVEGKSQGILYDGTITEGENTIAFKNQLKNGVYILLVQSTDFRDSIKMVF